MSSWRSCELLAEIRDYDSLHQALRARAEMLKVSRVRLDELCGLPDGYCAKLLAPNPLKLVGRQSLGALLEVMGCKLVLEEDPDAWARVKDRMTKRFESQVRANVGIPFGQWLFTKKNAREMRALSVLKTTAATRSLRARRAAIARWRGAR